MSSKSTIGRPGSLDMALLALTAIIWASAFSAIKIAVLELGPLWTAAMRVSIGFLALVPFAIFSRIDFPRKTSIWAILLLVAALNMVIPFALISWALQEVDAGIGALLMGTSPFLAMILGHFFTSDEKINGYKIIAVMLGLCGILTIVGPNVLSGLGSTKIASQFAIIFGAGCYVISGLLMRRMDMKPIAFTTIALAFGSIMLIAVAFAIEGIPEALPSNNAMLALLWLGIFPTGLAYVLRFYLVKRVGVSTFALGMNSIPVLGVIFGAIILGEQITFGTVIALALVISGLFVARLGMPKLVAAVNKS